MAVSSSSSIIPFRQVFSIIDAVESVIPADGDGYTPHMIRIGVPRYPRVYVHQAILDLVHEGRLLAGKAPGRHIPMVVENVRGAQPWVGRSRWKEWTAKVAKIPFALASHIACTFRPADA